MKTLAVIPARYASVRFPGKPLAMLRGKTMLQRTWERTQASPHVDQTIVATDDERIAAAARNFGAEVRLTRADHPSGTDRVAEVAAQMQSDFEVVINVQGDEPFLRPEQLELITRPFVDRYPPGISTLCERIETTAELFDPNVVKVVRCDQGSALYFSRAPLPYQRDVPPDTWLDRQPYYRHVGLYAFHMPALLQLTRLPVGELERCEKLEQLRWLAAGHKIAVRETTHRSVGVDTPEDLNYVLQNWNTLDDELTD